MRGNLAVAAWSCVKLVPLGAAVLVVTSWRIFVHGIGSLKL